MKKEEFFNQLEYLLQDIPDEEKQDALDYYRDYLAEAGSENEEQAISDFGSPERVAAIIRADLAGNLKEGGSFTERGYEDERFRDPNYQVVKRLDLPDEKGPEAGGAYQEGSGMNGAYQNSTYHNGAGQNSAYNNGTYQNNQETKYTYKNDTYQNSHGNSSAYQNGAYQNGTGTGGTYQNGSYQSSQQPDNQGKRRGSNKLLKAVLWIILILVAFPAILGGGGILLGIGGGIFGLVIGLVALVGGLVIAALATGFGLIVAGVRALFLVPLEGVLISGVGLIGVGIGLLAIVLIYALFAFLVPAIWKGIKRIVGNIRGRRP